MHSLGIKALSMPTTRARNFRRLATCRAKRYEDRERRRGWRFTQPSLLPGADARHQGLGGAIGLG